MLYAIDFGTSNSLLAAARDGQVIAPIPLDPDAGDPTLLRTILYFPTMKECYYGVRAIREFTQHDMTGRLIRSIKKYLPMRSFVGTWVDERPLNLEDIIGLFLKELRERANTHFGTDVTRAVLGRPARFSPDDAEDLFAQGRLEQAARFAGFTEVTFCPEPVAAAREFRSMAGGPSTVLVADFGGGTSDFTVIRVGKDEFSDTDVLSIGGVSIAGDAFDGAIMRSEIARHFGAEVSYRVPFGSNILKMPGLLMEKICSPADISLLRKKDTMEFFRNVRQWSLGDEDREKMDHLFSLIDDQLGFGVFEEIEGAKRELSDKDAAFFEFDYPGIRIREKLLRKKFMDYTSDQVGKILSSLDATVGAAGLKASQIDLVCCTGGTAKVYALRQALKERFGEAKVRQHKHFHSVALGLAERARDLC